MCMCVYVCLCEYVHYFSVNMEPKDVIDLIETIGLLLEKCDSDHLASTDESDLLYEPLPLYELCDPLGSHDELKTCCFCMISSRELANAILKIM